MNDSDFADDLVVRFDQMTWPAVREPLDRLEWTLRYGQPERSDLLHAASIIGAYRALVNAPRRQRQQIAAKIKSHADRT